MIELSRPAPGVALVRVVRPGRLNAIDPATADALVDALREIESDDSIATWVLTGTGRAFSVGADLRAIASRHAGSTRAGRGLGPVVRGPRAKPVVAAVNGLALGAGFELVLACDLVVMASTAELGLPEAGRGLMAANGGLVRLARALPPVVAAEVAVAGRRLSASEAERHGLVNAVVEPGDVVPTALELAERVATHAPLAVRGSLAVLRLAAWAPDQDAAWTASDTRYAAVRASADAREGPRAFAEGRAPRWQGR